MSYVELPITTDQAALQDDAHEFIQGKVPGYVLDPAHPTTWLIEAAGRMVAVALFQASLMPSANLRTLGETVYGIPRGDGTPATAVTTWTARDTDGHEIPAGTAVLIDGVPFTVDLTVTIPAGSSSTGTGEVSVTAIDVGTANNGLGATVESVDALVWLDTIALVGSTANGTDAQTDEGYQDFVTALLRLQAPRAITAFDFEVFTVYTLNGPRDGVARATVLDNYNADTSTSGVGGHITIVPIDSVGANCTTAVKNAIAADLGAKRVANLVVHVIDPTRTNVTVGYTVTAYDGFDKTALKAQIDEALASYFDPAQWGVPPFGEALLPFRTASRWINATTVRYLQVAKVIENVEGVAYIESLTVNGGTADVTMSGVAPLPALQPITTHTVH